MYTIRLSLNLNEESGIYTATSPDVPRLVTEGSDPDEINRNVREALEGLIEVWKDLGMEIPRILVPSSDRQELSKGDLVSSGYSPRLFEQGIFQ
jgi:antitoxin HicB